MKIKPIFILIFDISGYTKFIKLHKTSLLHAEHIISELLKSIIKESDPPIITDQVLGDAVSFYAEDDGRADFGDHLLEQVNKLFAAFRMREAELVSECDVCSCSACKQVSKLKIKSILHHGEAGLGESRDLKKMSGENVIIAHRLLKNTVETQEYILMTKNFFQRCQSLDAKDYDVRKEDCEGIGKVEVYVKHFEPRPLPQIRQSIGDKFIRFIKIEEHMIGRMMGKKPKEFRNLPV